MASKQSADTIVDGTANKVMTAAERTKLATLPGSVVAATDTVAGIVELATDAETLTGTDTTRAVTPANLAARIAALVNAAPGALDTLRELADAIGDDANYAATVTTALAAKESITNVDAKVAKWRHDLIAWLPPNTMSGGTWVQSTTVTGYGYNSLGSASGAYNYVYFATVTPGTWVVNILAYKASTAGIITYEYSTDGGSNWSTIVANQDMYNATVLGFLITSGNITISAAGRLDIRVRSTGTKNALSSGYYALTSQISVIRTA